MRSSTNCSRTSTESEKGGRALPPSESHAARTSAGRNGGPDISPRGTKRSPPRRRLRASAGALAANAAIIESRDAAKHVGLVHVSDEHPGIRRLRAGKGFRYVTAGRRPISDGAMLKRIKSLAIPPAWTDVWICSEPNGHIQATGRDAKGRKQYRYHERFREVRESTKYQHLLAFAEKLPKIRTRVKKDMALPGLPRERVLATVVHLLEATLIRVGSDEYARHNKSYGLTTLKNRHVEVDGAALRFNFKGKGGKAWRVKVKDRRVAKVIRACQDLPGQQLLHYIDEAGETCSITSTDVNDYLRAVSGDDVTAKDFRTWHGTVLAAMALREIEKCGTEAGAQKNIREAIQCVAARLGNTPTICRRCYVHPEILTAYVEGARDLEAKEKVGAEPQGDLAALSEEEAAVLSLLRTRLGARLKDKLKQSADREKQSASR